MSRLSQWMATSMTSAMSFGLLRFYLAFGDGVEHADHLDGGLGGALAGMSVGAADSFKGLFVGVGSEHAEDDRQVFPDGDVLEASCAFAGDVFEMGGIAA